LALALKPCGLLNIIKALVGEAKAKASGCTVKAKDKDLSLKAKDKNFSSKAKAKAMAEV